MLISNDITFNLYNTNKWVLSTLSGVHFVINKQVKDLIELLCLHTNYSEAFVDFNLKNKTHLNEKEFKYLVDKSLRGKNILKDDVGEFISKKEIYLRYKFPILSSKITNICGNTFGFLFNRNIFFILFTASFLLIIVTIITKWNIFLTAIGSLSLYKFPIVLFCILLISFLHELGHVLACKAAGLKAGEIGLGLNLYFPVLYADVTQIWKANRTQRLITNLAGIYFQFIIDIFLLGLYFATKSEVVLLLFFANTISAIFQLNPFLKHDGYWVLSDLFLLPNLTEKANDEVLKLLKKRTYKQLNPKLILYGVLNNTWIWLISAFLCYRYYPYIIELPSLLLIFIKNIAINHTLNFDKFNIMSVYSLLFYALFINRILNIVQKNFRKSIPIVSIP